MIYVAVLFHRPVSKVKTLVQFFNNILACFMRELMFVSYCIDLTWPDIHMLLLHLKQQKSFVIRIKINVYD